MTRRVALILAVAGATTLQFASAASSIVVSGAWSRPATATAVVYARIANNDARPDRLIAASSRAAARVELHESMESAMTMGSMNGIPMHGEMVSMKPLAAIGIPAHGVRTLAPGSYHLMLVGLRRDLKPGDNVPLRLHFARAGWISLTVPVRGT